VGVQGSSQNLSWRNEASAARLSVEKLKKQRREGEMGILQEELLLPSQESPDGTMTKPAPIEVDWAESLMGGEKGGS